MRPARGGMNMSKPVLGLVLGGVLGLLDGLSALFYPDAASMIVPIVVGSTIKGLVTGAALGVLARRVRSTAIGALVGLALGLVLSYLAALAPDPQGNHHYLEIMLPGAILGVIVGFATQRFGGRTAGTAAAPLAVLLLLPSIVASPASAQTAKAAPDPFGQVRFLVGQWSGSSEGQAGKGTVTRSYELALKDRFIHERNRSEYPPQTSNPKGEIHDHWSFFSYDRMRKALVLRQFHVEGFVITYRLAPTGGSAERLVFESEHIENLPAEWRARETYELTSPEEFTETFEVAPPGKPYEVYGKARLRRTR
jgi:hypothetical protein